jgi:UDP-N-acetylmuramate dehydrogenase
MDDKMIDDLKKKIKGKVLLQENLGRHTTFRIGGPADLWVEPHDPKELKKALLFAKENKTPFVVVGGGSNLLVSDSGIKGMVIHLGSPHFKDMSAKGGTVTAGAGSSIASLVRFCCNEGLTGMESLVGIPGTLGGALYMNAGGSSNPIFKNIGEFVSSVKVMDHSGNIRTIKRDRIEFGYRKSNLSSCIILQVVFKLEKGDKEVLNSSCSKFLTMKRQKQALDVPSAGCVFKNPEGFQFTCGQMIDMLGLKGKKVGGAEISEKHGNFIVNRKGATAEDVKGLIDFVKSKVKENYNIDLELEIKVM